VREDCRNNSIGISLIKYVMNRYQLSCIAETDSSAVKFYETSKCMEQIKEYNGERVIRFTCIKGLP
jgi:hypothetical protein